MLAYFTVDGERMMDRLEADHFSGSPVEMGIDKLTSNEMDASEAALLYDGRIVLGQEWLDAIIIEMRTYAAPDAVAIMAIPYTPKDAGGFLVHKVKLLEWKNCDGFDRDDAMSAFWEGVLGHKHGLQAWRDCLDESK
jgi:hypothetical protein